jgi:hypothetical protein
LKLSRVCCTWIPIQWSLGTALEPLIQEIVPFGPALYLAHSQKKGATFDRRLSSQFCGSPAWKKKSNLMPPSGYWKQRKYWSWVTLDNQVRTELGKPMWRVNRRMWGKVWSHSRQNIIWRIPPMIVYDMFRRK